MAGKEGNTVSQEYMAWYVDGSGKLFAVGVHGFTDDEVRASQDNPPTTEQIKVAEASGSAVPAIPRGAILERVITPDQNGTK
jgi:hypothetical protein